MTVFVPSVLTLSAVIQNGNIGLLHCDARVSTMDAQESLSAASCELKITTEDTRNKEAA